MNQSSLGTEEGVPPSSSGLADKCSICGTHIPCKNLGVDIALRDVTQQLCEAKLFFSRWSRVDAPTLPCSSSW